MRLGLNIFLGLVMLLLIACSSDTEGVIQPNVAAIFMDDISTDRITTDVFATSDNGVLVFGVQGSNITSKFNGDAFFILKIDNQGKIQNDTAVALTSFPSNVAFLNGNYHVYLNGIDSNAALTVNELGEIVSSKENLPKFSFDFFINSIIPNISNDGFIGLGIGTDFLDNNASYINTYNINFEPISVLSKREFFPSQVGVNSADITTILNQLTLFLQVVPFQDLYLINTPIDSSFGLSFLGERESIFKSNEEVVTAIKQRSDGNYIITTFNSIERETHVNTNFNPELKYGITITNEDIDLLDGSSPVKILISSDDTEMWIAGTSVTGEALIIPFKKNNNGEFMQKETVTIGHTFRYEIAGIVETQDQNSLVLVGYTNVAYQFNRVFFIKIPKSQI